MTAHTRAVVWLDTEAARVLCVTSKEIEKERIGADSSHRKVHPRAGSPGTSHVRDNREYFEAILAELTEVDEWLIVGPADIANDFEKYVRVGHAEALAKKLVGVDAMDRPTDAELMAHARRRFRNDAAQQSS